MDRGEGERLRTTQYNERRFRRVVVCIVISGTRTIIRIHPPSILLGNVV